MASQTKPSASVGVPLSKETLARRMPGVEENSPPAQEVRALLPSVLKAFYADVLEHKNCTLIMDPDALDLHAYAERTGVTLGRTDETGALRACALAVPYALRKRWMHSPNSRIALEASDELSRVSETDSVTSDVSSLASLAAETVDVETVLEEHAEIARLMLAEGVLVVLLVPGTGSSEAIYATDVATGFPDGAIALAKMCHKKRHDERRLYANADIDLVDHLDKDVAVEWGDVILAQHAETGATVVIQGVESMRSNERSIAGMGELLEHLEAESTTGRKYSQFPVRLRGDAPGFQGDILHLDYTHMYAGEGSTRVLVVCPDAFVGGSDTVAELCTIYGVRADRVIEVPPELALRGATNFSNLDPQTIIYYDNDEFSHIAEALEGFGFTVLRTRFDESSKKDGRLHCCIAQLSRDMPPRA